ncbi:MAG: hypothetical protein NC324_00380 [Bacteroides sp.]|nr:hypothetical protein [Bacteroides sp.]
MKNKIFLLVACTAFVTTASVKAQITVNSSRIAISKPLYGTWNEKYGYGLIDAYSAVKKAKTYCPVVELKNQTITSEKTVMGCSINVENVTMKQGGKLIFDAAEAVITAPFSMEAGTQLTVK